MYLDIVLVDYLNPDGVLTTYRITPKESGEKVVIDRLRDIDTKFSSHDSMDIGGARIYNTSSCSIQIQQTKLRKYSPMDSDGLIFFTLEHLGIPVGSQRQAHGGYYNFILPPSFRFTDLHIVDPYDNNEHAIEKKKHFRSDVIWDTSCNTSLAKMFLTSSRGTFSFILLGRAKLYDGNNKSEFLNAQETQYAVSSIFDYHIISADGKKTLTDDIAKKSEWLELKPNIMGFGINLNAIIKDSIQAFQNKVKK
ncbi:MAG: hypothetical protein IPP66_01795 [Anaerolineales bacterium]|nr:hypothetical protein [Anaerolineales bacterium]